ncbi:hypothetical protein F511_19906 [Dorcoceras hygrometricum]|uniref:Uncharacterized protein n=1 Tax=Dorcoceras hygrometricum TaxID=472368 RepID=A0A2Z7DCE1_9LAMI|nr:hypothetical protein F511_19906 [Dorcoceras hygrometricum]
MRNTDPRTQKQEKKHEVWQLKLTITARWYPDTKNLLVTTLMIALDLSGTTHLSSDHNVDLNQILRASPTRRSTTLNWYQSKELSRTSSTPPVLIQTVAGIDDNLLEKGSVNSNYRGFAKKKKREIGVEKYAKYRSTLKLKSSMCVRGEHILRISRSKVQLVVFLRDPNLLLIPNDQISNHVNRLGSEDLRDLSFRDHSKLR